MKVYHLLSALFLFVCVWSYNFSKFQDCDFKFSVDSNFRCEMVHGLGLIPPFAIFTAWSPSDK